MKDTRAFFVRAKHWQVFLILFPLALITILPLLTSSKAGATEDRGRLELLIWLFGLPGLVCNQAYLWSVGSFLNSVAKPSLRLDASYFGLALVYPPLYDFVSVVAPSYVHLQMSNPLIPELYFMLNALTVVCLFYGLYFVAKSLVLAEKNKPVSSADYAGPLILFALSFIGVWLLQPRINRLCVKNEELPQAREAATG